MKGNVYLLLFWRALNVTLKYVTSAALVWIKVTLAFNAAFWTRTLETGILSPQKATMRHQKAQTMAGSVPHEGNLAVAEIKGM
jgi:hypothetical protein